MKITDKNAKKNTEKYWVYPLFGQKNRLPIKNQYYRYCWQPCNSLRNIFSEYLTTSQYLEKHVQSTIIAKAITIDEQSHPHHLFIYFTFYNFSKFSFFFAITKNIFSLPPPLTQWNSSSKVLRLWLLTSFEIVTMNLWMLLAISQAEFFPLERDQWIIFFRRPLRYFGW